MAQKRLVQITDATSVTAQTKFVGVEDSGTGTGVDGKYTLGQAMAFMKQAITVDNSAYVISNTGHTLTGAYFSNTITEIVTNNQCYIVGVDFSQAGTAISWINGNTWNLTQKLIAKQ